MQVSLSRTVGFRATHRYFKPEWTAEQNRSSFGPAGDAPGHPHDYACTVTVSGPLDPATDMVMDLAALDLILAETVVSRLHGKHLNLDVAEFSYGNTLPSCEALAREIFGRIAARLPEGVTLIRVRVAEDATLHADCTPDT